MTQMMQMKLMLTIGLMTRILRKLGIERLIERFCRVLGDGIAHFCCQSVLGSDDNRRAKDDISRVAILVL
jgi:hypothetical protein